jgi:hypothetical protein
MKLQIVKQKKWFSSCRSSTSTQAQMETSQEVKKKQSKKWIVKK